MKQSFNFAKPKHEVVMEYILEMIINDSFKEGDKLPLVSDISLSLDVNPNTVQSALSELTARGILSSKRGEGRFIGSKDKALEMRDEIAFVKCKTFLSDMAKLGIKNEDSIEFLRRKFRLSLKKIAEISNVTKKSGKKYIFDNLNLTFEEGDIVYIESDDKNLVNEFFALLSGLSNCNDGYIKINNEKIESSSKRYISYVPPENNLYQNLTVKKMILFCKDFFKGFHDEKAIELALQYSINLKSKIKKLSESQKQILSLILAICKNANLFLFNDPFNKIDENSYECIADLIKQNIKKQCVYVFFGTKLSFIDEIITKKLKLSDNKIEEINYFDNNNLTDLQENPEIQEVLT